MSCGYHTGTALLPVAPVPVVAQSVLPNAVVKFPLSEEQGKAVFPFQPTMS